MKILIKALEDHKGRQSLLIQKKSDEISLISPLYLLGISEMKWIANGNVCFSLLHLTYFSSEKYHSCFHWRHIWDLHKHDWASYPSSHSIRTLGSSKITQSTSVRNLGVIADDHIVPNRPYNTASHICHF